MAEKNKYKKNLSGFLRYKKGEMTGEERNSFERELQRDSFAEEAAEGFEEVTAEVLGRHISHLEEKLRKRTSGSSRLIIYSVAASIAVLMIISVFLMLENRSGTREQLAVSDTGVVLEISESQPVTKPKIEDKTIPADSRQPVKEAEPSEMPQLAEAEVSESKKDDISEVRISEVLPFAPAAAARKSDKKELRGATRSKVEGTAVVVGYGAKKAGTEKNESQEYYPPRPIDGKDAFDKYVFENIRRPDTSTAGQRVVVVAGFRVKTDGTIDSISIIRSPDSSFSEEAKRLIRSGPAWNPAERDGMPVADDVRVRIVFK